MSPLKMLRCFVNAVHIAFFESHCFGFMSVFYISVAVQEWADSSAHGQLSATPRLLHPTPRQLSPTQRQPSPTLETTRPTSQTPLAIYLYQYLYKGHFNHTILLYMIYVKLTFTKAHIEAASVEWHW